MGNLTPAVLRGILIGFVLVLVSLPLLFALHGALGLGSPPLPGLILLGGTVALALALANVAGVFVGEARGNPFVAALVGLGIGICACGLAAPFYGGLVVDGLTHDATGLVWSERGRLTQAARDAVQNGAGAGAGNTARAVREGRVRGELADLQKQAQNATTPAARQNAAERAKDLAAQMTPKGIAVLKSGAARLSAFGLLLWALVAPPLGAAFECRRARR